MTGTRLGLGTALLLAVWVLVPPAEAAGKAAPVVEADSVPVAKAPSIDIPKMRDPFESYIQALQQQNKARMESHRKEKPDHAPQPLEAFDLSALKLVAIMQMGEKRAAMVQDPQGKGYVVRLGSYIGRDNGRVVGISDTGVQILEDTFSPTGALVKRKASMTLKEIASKK